MEKRGKAGFGAEKGGILSAVIGIASSIATGAKEKKRAAR